MSEERTTKISTSTESRIYYSQRCLCCDNTRALPEGMTYSRTPWVCDECREAIAFLKFLKSYDQKLVKTIMEATNENSF